MTMLRLMLPFLQMMKATMMPTMIIITSLSSSQHHLNENAIYDDEYDDGDGDDDYNVNDDDDNNLSISSWHSS